MNFNSKKEIEEYGFEGFKSVADLWNNKNSIPKSKGVYMILDPNYHNPQFIAPGVGGFFKGKNPNVPIKVLQSNLVPNSYVIYIGKAGSMSGSATLNSRLGQFLRFGQNKNVGHWGGRYIWQIRKHSELIFCWKPTQF